MPRPSAPEFERGFSLDSKGIAMMKTNKAKTMKKHTVSAKCRKNLRPLGHDKRSREIQRAGGLANAKRAEMLKTLREYAVLFRDQPALADEFKGMTNGGGVIAAMYAAAQRGNVSAASFLANLMGELEAKITLDLPIIRDDVPRQPDPEK